GKTAKTPRAPSSPRSPSSPRILNSALGCVVSFERSSQENARSRVLQRTRIVLQRVDSFVQHRPSRALDRGPFCFIEDSFTHTPHGAWASAILSTDVLRLRLLDGDVRPGTGRRGGCVYDPRILRQARCSIGVAVGLVTATAATKDSLAEAERFANHPAPSTAP